MHGANPPIQAAARQGAATACIQREGCSVSHAVRPGASGWRDDLRLFAVTWAMGFLFFLVVIA